MTLLECGYASAVLEGSMFRPLACDTSSAGSLYEY
jgi:hypothetical protein